VAQTSYSHSDLEALWNLVGGFPSAADTAAAIAQAESGGCLYAKAGPTDDRPAKVCTYRETTSENSYGLWQINRYAHPTYSASDLYDAQGNAEAARAISSNGTDWTPWTTYTSGAYRQYLTSGGEPTPQPGATAPPTAGEATTSGHHGYADLRNSVARHLPTQLQRSREAGAATLRTLAGKRKVGH
jgi:Lysozyme like domain